VESRVRADRGGDTWASRDSFVGLQSGFGTIRLGRTIGPVYYQTYDSLPENNHDTGNSSDALLAPAIFGNSGFMNNTVWYTSPTMSGFTVEAAYSLLGEAPLAGTDSKPHYAGVVGAYDQGPLHVALSYAETKNSADLDPAVVKFNSDTAVTLAGVYDFKVVVLGLLYERAKSDLLVGDVKRNYYRASVMVPIGQHEIHVNYGHVDHRLDTNTADANQWGRWATTTIFRSGPRSLPS
jgi:predicted porin